MAGIAHVGVILGSAGQGKRVMAADGVAYYFNQGLHILVKELGIQAWPGISRTHQSSCGGGVEPPLQLAAAKSQEVRALSASNIDHLDIFASLHLVSKGRSLVDGQVEPQV